jgi:Uma2 family endonuclease
MKNVVREPPAPYLAPPRVLPCHTWEDYAGWEGDWELIRGVPFSMSPAPKMAHALVRTQLVLLLQSGLRGDPSWCVLSGMDWIVDAHTTIRPDVMVARAPLGDDWLRKPPELVVEVLSPSTAAKDRIEKRSICEMAGVRYFLLADPVQKTLEAFVRMGSRYTELPAKGNCLDLDFDGVVVSLSLPLLFEA